MPHEIDRIVAAAAAGCWFIEPRKACEIVGVMALRAEAGAGVFAEGDRAKAAAAKPRDYQGRDKVTRVIPLHGTILPRANLMSALSGAASLDQFAAMFREAATDPQVGAIVLDIDSPGGQVDLVPETVAMMRAHKRADRPIVAVANTMAASAAYWIASAADEIVVTQSGLVGSIGVYMMHENIAERLRMEGIERTFIYEGPRKVEGNPFQPLDEAAASSLQSEVKYFYDLFTSDVAKGRGVPVGVVRADPEKSDEHFGGGRVYPGAQAVRLGMADRVGTLEDTIGRVARGRPARASIERRRLALR